MASTHSPRTRLPEQAPRKWVSPVLVALNIITNDNQAQIESTSGQPQTSVSFAGGDLSLATQNTSSLTATAMGSESGASAKVGVGAAVAINVATNTSDAEVQSGVTLAEGHNASLTADSNQTTTTTSQAGSAGDVSITPAVSVADISDSSTANLGSGNDLQLSGSLTISATHTATTTATAKGEADPNKAGFGIALALNIATDTATASLNRSVYGTGGATSAIGGSASITASNVSSVLANGVAGVGGNDGGTKQQDGSTSGGADSSDTETQNQTSFAEGQPGAPSNNPTVKSQSQAMSSKSNSSDSSSSASGAESGHGESGQSGATIGVAASVGVNAVKSQSIATVADGLTLRAGGNLAIESTNGTIAGVSADSTAVSPDPAKTSENSVAAAISLNLVDETNQATAGNNVTLQGGSVSIQAFQPTSGGTAQPDDFRAWSLGGASGTQNAVGGSVALNILNTSSAAGTKAGIGTGGDISTTGNLTISATSNMTERGVAGVGAFGGNVGVGASVVVNVISNETDAGIGSSTKADAGGALTVEATGSITPSQGILSWESQAVSNLIPSSAETSKIPSLPVSSTSLVAPSAMAVGGAGGGDVGVAGSVDINVFFESTTAHIDASAQINQRAAGSTNSGVTVKADDNLNLLDIAGGIAAGGDVGVGLGVDVSVINRDTEATIGSGASVSSQGAVTVTAPVTETLFSLAADAAVGGYVGASGAVSVIVINNTDKATISDAATVTAGGNIAVTSGFQSSSEQIEQFAGGAGGGFVGAGIANVTLVKNDTIASTIGNDATITTHGSTGLYFDATLPEDVTSVAIGAGGGGVGLAGAVTVNDWTDSTTASIGDGGSITATGQITTGISVTASNTTQLTSSAAVVAIAGVAVGVGVDIGIIGKTTTATLGGSNDQADGDVIVKATSSEAINSIVAAATGSPDAALSGVASVDLLSATTQADIDSGSSVTAQGNIQVAADESTQHLGLSGSANVSGGVSGGLVAVVPVFTKTTSAFIGANSNVNAQAKHGSLTAETGKFGNTQTSYGANGSDTVAPPRPQPNRLEIAKFKLRFDSDERLVGRFQ